MLRQCVHALLLASLIAVAASAAEAPAPGVAAAALTLATDSGGTARISWNPTTGAARLVRLEPGSLAVAGVTAADRAEDFLLRYGAAFGVTDPQAMLERVSESTDRLGQTHLAFRQLHHGVPVFAAVLRVHFDRDGQLAAVNGGLLPALALASTTPDLSAAEAGAAALAVAGKGGRQSGRPPLSVARTTLSVFREGLVRGTHGRDHLVWEVEVGDGAASHELLFVDAHDGTVVDRIDLTEELTRRVHRTTFGNIVWREGDPLPYQGSDAATNAEVNTLIETAGDTYSLFRNLSGGTYLSFDGHDATMDSVQNATNLDCPNAAWDGQKINVCLGMAADDVVAHEWTHAYTGATDGLIYQWQPGALSESFSDIFGETVDLLNGRGADAPGPHRAVSGCSSFAGSGPPNLVILAPETVAGTYAAGGAVFNPEPPWSVEGQLELVADGTMPESDGCQALVGFTAGRIALVDRGNCTFRVKVQNAQSAGAIAVIVVNDQGDDLVNMVGDGPRFTIPSVFIGQSDGNAVKAALAEGVTASLSAETGSDPSLRWLIGEDTAYGVIRDMWRPGCFANPAQVSDVLYACGTRDNGGVHSNSGVPNHAYALLADGGQFNGQSVGALGLTRAAHVYWRAMSVYQVPTTDFADHADLVELSCRDLIGQTLTDPVSGRPSTDVVDASDCAQVAKAMAAVEMRNEPSQCHFQPLLAPDAPALVDSRTVFADDFELDPAGRWTFSNEGVHAEYRPRDWEWTDDVPANGSGHALFALDSARIGNCQPGSDDQSSVRHADSPSITLPAGSVEPVLLFDHWVATEAGYDGGNVKVSVNGGAFVLVPGSAFRFNPYNATLVAAPQNTDPLAGEPAFTGSNGGSLEGSWGQSQVDLASFAGAGDTLQVRFDFGVDGCNGVQGWYVDNVRLAVSLAPRRPGGRVGSPAP